MNLSKFFIIIIAFVFSFNFSAIADHHDSDVVVRDAIIVESDFDLEQTYETKDYSDIPNQML